MDSATFQGIFALIFYTNFVELFTVLTLLRLGLGFIGGGMGVIMGGLALAFAIIGVDTSGSTFTFHDLFKPGINWEQTFKENVRGLAKPEITHKLIEIRDKKQVGVKNGDSDHQSLLTQNGEKIAELSQQEASFSVLVASSIFSQVIEGFKTGSKLLIPFLVIDLLLGVIISGLGIINFSIELLSTPLKIIFFVTVGGWELMFKILA